MTLQKKLEAAFAGRRIPAEIVEPSAHRCCDSDVEEALWFTGREWHSLTLEDWQQHRHAVHFFSPEAFAYYLPSLLLAAAQSPEEWLYSAETVLISLDLSPSKDGWSDHFRARFLQLRREELDVLKEWLVLLCEYPTYRGYGLAAAGPGESFARAFDTVELLQQELVRQTTGVPAAKNDGRG